jgi:hypothetical protein
VTGANFVHVPADDTPGKTTYVIPIGGELVARAECVAGTKAYFGVISLDTGQLGGHEAKAFALAGDHSPYVGDFDADGCHDIAWFDAVGDELHVWRCLPSMRDFDCGATLPTPPDAAPVGMHWGF